MKDLAGRVAVVTGGASGIGRATARRFAAESMRVVVADVEEPPLQETVSGIRAEGGEAMAMVCDVSSWPSVEALSEATARAYGPADVVCNNAGVAGSGTVAEASLQTWEWCLGVNLWGVIHGCRAFLPAMIERGAGHVVNTASVLGHICSPGVGPYNVSKYGVVALSETLHLEMEAAGTGVGVTCLCPGLVSTNILDSERNRPERLLDDAGRGALSIYSTDDESELLAAVREAYRHAMDPSVVADMVLEAIINGQFWLFTDGHFDGFMAERHRGIEAGGTPGSGESIVDTLLGGPLGSSSSSGEEDSR